MATAYHVVNEPGSIVAMLPDGTERKARVVSADARFDVALLELDGPVPTGVPIEDRDPRTVTIGAPLAAIGHPYAHEFLEARDEQGLFVWALTTGILSGRNGDLLLTDVAVNPGNSGGPVLDCDGRVVGVVSQHRGTLGVAISVAHLQEIARTMTGRPFSFARWLGGSALDLGWDGRFGPAGSLTGPSIGFSFVLASRIVFRAGFTGLIALRQTTESSEVTTSTTGGRIREGVGVIILNKVLPFTPSLGIATTWLVEHQLRLAAGGGIQADDVASTSTSFSPSLEVGRGLVTLSYEADIDFSHLGDTAHTLRLALRFGR